MFQQAESAVEDLLVELLAAGTWQAEAINIERLHRIGVFDGVVAPIGNDLLQGDGSDNGAKCRTDRCCNLAFRMLRSN